MLDGDAVVAAADEAGITIVAASAGQSPADAACAVIGVGHLGQHHARLLAAMPDVELVGVVDIKPERADGDCRAARHDARSPMAADARRPRRCRDDRGADRCRTSRWRCRSSSRRRACWSRSRWRATLARGRPAGQAARRGAARCWPSATPNGSIRPWRRRCRSCRRPRFIEIHRLGTFPERSLDIDVIFDLMIHDLDLLLAIGRFGGRVGRGRRRERADAARRHRQRAAAICVGLHRQRDGQPDQPRARAQGAVLPARLVRVDRLRGAGGRGLSAGARQNGGRPVIEGGRLDVANDEPLRRELEDFVDAVRDERHAGRHRATTAAHALALRHQNR